MRVQVSQPMTKLINEVFQDSRVKLLKMNPAIYENTIDYDLFRHTDDYNINSGMFKVIEIIWSAEYYAMPSYITTRDLVRVFRSSDGTLAGFKESIKREFAI